MVCYTPHIDISNTKILLESVTSFHFELIINCDFVCYCLLPPSHYYFIIDISGREAHTKIQYRNLDLNRKERYNQMEV